MITISPPLKKSIAAAVKDFGEGRFFWTWIGEGLLEGAVPALDGARFDIQERVKRISFKLRQEYIDYVGAISRQQQADWWRSSVSEKNPYVSSAFFYACCIKAALEEIDQGSDGSHYLFVVQDHALRRALFTNCDKQAPQAP